MSGAGTPSSPPRRGRIGEHVRETILEAAAEELAEHPETSMSDLAEAAGVGRATLYRYFPTRESLLAALMVAAQEEAVRGLREAQLETVAFPEGLARAARALAAVGSRFVVLAREHPIAKAPPEDSELVAHLSVLLGRGRAEGRLRDDVPLDWLVLAFGTTLLAGIDYGHRQGLGTEEVAALVAAQFLRGASRSP